MAHTLKIRALIFFGLTFGCQENTPTDFGVVVIPISVTDYELSTVRLDLEPLVFKVNAVIGTNSCYAYSHMDFQKTANQVDVWIYGIYDSTRQCNSGEITLENVEYSIDPPFANPLKLVFHQADNSVIQVDIEIRKANTDSQWIIYTKYFSGLPSNNIQSLLFDGDDGIWAGSKAGVFHFDGQNITYQADRQFSIYDNYIEALTMDNDGNLWAGSYSTPYISKYNGSMWQFFMLPGADTLDYWDVHSITADADNSIWVGTHGGQLLTFDGALWTEHQVIDSLTLRYTETLLVDESGHVWVGGVYGLLGEWNGTEWMFHEKVPSEGSRPYVQDMNIDSEGNIWVSDRNFGLHKFDGVSWVDYPFSASGLGIEWIINFEFDSHGNIWIISSTGLVKFDGTSWTAYNRSNTAMISDNIRALAIDHSDQIWLGTNDFGITLFKNGN